MPKKVDTAAEVDADADEEAADVVEMVQVPFRGLSFAIPKLMDEWDTEACIAINGGDFITAAKILLGPEQWTRLRSLGTKRKDTNDFLVSMGRVTRSEVIN